MFCPFFSEDLGARLIYLADLSSLLYRQQTSGWSEQYQDTKLLSQNLSEMLVVSKVQDAAAEAENLREIKMQVHASDVGVYSKSN